MCPPYMDDLKVYAQNPKSLKATLATVIRVSESVGKSLGLRKCVVAHMRKGGSVRYETDMGQVLGYLNLSMLKHTIAKYL